MWPPTIEEIESIGWKLDSKYDFGYHFNWKKDLEYYNCPTLFIGIKEGYNKVNIMKFSGANDWYGHMDTAFLGRCDNLEQLILICDLLELDDYVKFK